MTPRYLAIDPAVKACGLAWRTGRNKPILVDTWSVNQIHNALSAIKHDLLKVPTHAVIEQANGYGNIKAAFALAEARGRIIEACERAGLTVIRVHVATWQSAMLRKSSKKGDSKERSIESAKSLGVVTDDHNIADAVNMLVYAELNRLGEDGAK